MITMNVAYFNKVGNIEKAGIIYKYIFASTSPHFYFTGYVVPRDSEYDFYAIPKTNNFEDNSAIKLDDNSNFSKKTIQYGEKLELTIANDDLIGFSNFIDIEISVEERPVAINGDSSSENISDYVESIIKPLEDIKAYKLMDIIRVEVTSNISAIDEFASIDYERAIESFVFTLLINESVFNDHIPEGLYNSDSFAYELYGKILYGSAYSSDIATVFSDIIYFLREVKNYDIDLTVIPVHILAILASRWAKTKNKEFINKIRQASNGVPITMEISLNPVTISDETRLFQVLSEIQNFIYINKVEIYKDQIKVNEISLDNVYYENLYRVKDECLVQKEVKNLDKFFRITYGYGTGDCENFIGMNFEDRENLVYYGINKKDVLINDIVETAVVYESMSDKIEMLNGELDSSLGLTFVFKGV